MYVNSQMSCNLNTTVLAMNYNSQTYIVMAISGAEYDLKEIGKEMKQTKGGGEMHPIEIHQADSGDTYYIGSGICKSEGAIESCL